MRYKCLVLDHDDTVVDSETTVNYPCFLLALDRFRPGEYMGQTEFAQWCFHPGFTELLRQKYQFTDQEMKDEFQMWLDYAKDRIPPACCGIREIILKQKARGGLVCVVSHSGRYNISRDYAHHFGFQPDMIFSSEDPVHQRKPNPYPLERIMEEYGLKASDLLMVDDLKPGYDMAKKLGVDFAYAGWSRKNVPQITAFMERYCDFLFESTEELYHFLFD